MSCVTTKSLQAGSTESPNLNTSSPTQSPVQSPQTLSTHETSNKPVSPLEKFLKLPSVKKSQLVLQNVKSRAVAAA